MISGLIAALGFAGGVLVQKYELSKRKLPINLFLPASFLMLCFFTGVLLLLLGQPIFLPSIVFNSSYLLALIGMLLCATGWNILYCQALSKETVQEFDLILMTEPLVTIAMAGIVFSGERNALVFLLALIAGIALVFSHMRRKRIRFDHYAKELIIAIFLMSLEVIFIRSLLQFIPPITLYFWRTFVVFAAFFWFYKPNFDKLKISDMGILSVVAVFGVMQMVARYYGYESDGVVVTTLVLLLGPLAVEISSIAILKEKISLRIGAAFAVIFLCVVYASLINLVR